MPPGDNIFTRFDQLMRDESMFPQMNRSQAFWVDENNQIIWKTSNAHSLELPIDAARTHQVVSTAHMLHNTHPLSPFSRKVPRSNRAGSLPTH